MILFFARLDSLDVLVWTVSVPVHLVQLAHSSADLAWDHRCLVWGLIGFRLASYPCRTSALDIWGPFYVVLTVGIDLTLVLDSVLDVLSSG